MLQGRIVIVTNVRHFVGLPAASEMARQGARVYCHDKSFADPELLEQFVSEHPDLNPVADGDCDDLLSHVHRMEGRIDAIVSNDAHPAIRAPVESASLDDLRTALEEMLVAPFALAALVTPFMKSQKSGKILFVTSAVPLRGLPNYSMYVAARGGANALAITLAQELAPYNIQVNAIAPNYVESPSYFPPELLSNPDVLEKITRHIPLKRLGKPEEVGRIIAFYASDASDFLTGHVLPVAGGWA